MLRVLGAAQVLCRAHVATDMVELKSHRCPLRCAWLCWGMAGVQMGSEMFRDDQRCCPKSAFPGEQSKTGTSMHILGDAQWCGNGQREEL